MKNYNLFKLSDLGTKNTGINITASKMNEISNPEGDLRIYAAGNNVIQTFSSQINNEPINSPSVIVKSRGYIDFEFCDVPFTHKNELWSYSFSDYYLAQYISYYLQSKRNYFQKKAKSMSVKLPQINQKVTDEYLIPIPNESIIKFIVNTLNNFSNLIFTLKAELELREKQFNYYINTLIEESINKNTEWIQIDKLGSFLTGLSGKNKDDFLEEANKPFISYTEVFENFYIDSINKKNLVKIQDQEKQNQLEYGDIIFTGSSETREEAGFSSVYLTKNSNKVYLNSFCFILRLDNFNLLDPEFLKFLFRSKLIRKEIIKSSNGVTRFNISKRKFGRIKIPILSSSKQKEITNILNSSLRLIKLLKDEILLREKQYIYYRDKLLDFGDES